MADSEQVSMHPVGPFHSAVAVRVRYRFYVVTAFVCLWSERLTDGSLVASDGQVKLLRFRHRFTYAARSSDAYLFKGAHRW